VWAAREVVGECFWCFLVRSSRFFSLGGGWCGRLVRWWVDGCWCFFSRRLRNFSLWAVGC